MELFTEDNATQVVQQRNCACKDPRTRRILDVVTAHLHAIVRELEPTRTEWEQAIAFLTRTGQMCSDARQEFILLSDTLGVVLHSPSTALGSLFALPERKAHYLLGLFGPVALLPLLAPGRLALGLPFLAAALPALASAVNAGWVGEQSFGGLRAVHHGDGRAGDGRRSPAAHGCHSERCPVGELH